MITTRESSLPVPIWITVTLLTRHAMLTTADGWFMERKTEEKVPEMAQRISLRGTVMQALGAVLIAMGLFVDWPPSSEAGLPDTSSFLLILGVLVGAAGLLAAFRRE